MQQAASRQGRVALETGDGGSCLTGHAQARGHHGGVVLTLCPIIPGRTNVLISVGHARTEKRVCSIVNMATNLQDLPISHRSRKVLQLYFLFSLDNLTARMTDSLERGPGYCARTRYEIIIIACTGEPVTSTVSLNKTFLVGFFVKVERRWLEVQGAGLPDSRTQIKKRRSV